MKTRVLFILWLFRFAHKLTLNSDAALITNIQSNFDGLNIFGTIENCSRHGWFEPLRVNYGAKSGSKWR